MDRSCKWLFWSWILRETSDVRWQRRREGGRDESIITTLVFTTKKSAFPTSSYIGESSFYAREIWERGLVCHDYRVSSLNNMYVHMHVRCNRRLVLEMCSPFVGSLSSASTNVFILFLK